MPSAESTRRNPHAPIEVNMMPTREQSFLGPMTPRLVFDAKSYPELFKGTHRLMIGKTESQDPSLAHPQGYLVVSCGRLLFLPPDEDPKKSGFLEINRTADLPTADNVIKARTFSQDNLYDGEIRLAFEMILKEEAPAGNSFVIVLEEDPNVGGLRKPANVEPTDPEPGTAKDEKIQINGRLVGGVVLLTAAAIAAVIGSGIGVGLIIEKLSPSQNTSCCDHQEE